MPLPCALAGPGFRSAGSLRAAPPAAGRKSVPAEAVHRLGGLLCFCPAWVASNSPEDHETRNQAADWAGENGVASARRRL